MHTRPSSMLYAYTLQSVPHPRRRRLHWCNRRKSTHRNPPRLPLVCPQMGARDRVGRMEDERRPRLRLPRRRLLCLCIPRRSRRPPRCSPSNLFHSFITSAHPTYPSAFLPSFASSETLPLSTSALPSPLPSSPQSALADQQHVLSSVSSFPANRNFFAISQIPVSTLKTANNGSRTQCSSSSS